MKILAVETSTMLGGVAIVDDAEGLVAETRLNIRTTHSEELMTGIDFVLRHAGMKITDVDLFGVATGPGSFTGLRIGLSTVKGFSYATGRPVVAVPTLEAFAWNFPFSTYPVCTMLDARKKEVYAALFRWRDEGFEKIMEETSIAPGDLVKVLQGPVVLAGEGAVLYKDVLRGALAENALFAPAQWMVPSPSNVAFLALKKAGNGEFADPAGLVPLYIRRSEAEVKFQKAR